MRNANELSKTTYILKHIWWCYIALIWFRIIFECIPHLDYSTSKNILYVLLLSGCIFGIASNIKTRRNNFSMAVNIIIPFGIYTFIVYIHYFKVATILVILVALLPITFYGILIFGMRIKNIHKKNIILKRRFKTFAYGSRSLLAMCMAVMIVFMGVKTTLSGSLLKSDVQATNVQSNDEEWTIANNIETLCKLQYSVWCDLSLAERMDVLQIICNIEANYLGTDFELNLSASPLEECVLGQFNENSHSITIDMELVKFGSSEEVLSTLLHECRHGYQYSCVSLLDDFKEEDKDLYIYREIAEYKYGFDNYDKIPYYTNPVEMDARQYSRESVEDYFNRIKEHLEKD